MYKQPTEKDWVFWTSFKSHYLKFYNTINDKTKDSNDREED